MGCFAVIDTETNWIDQVMSIGTVIADCDSFRILDARYHDIDPEYRIGGMYEGELFADTRLKPTVCTRQAALQELGLWLGESGVTDLYAYNASFDRNHLPEFAPFSWHDIIRMAAYRQTNPHIPADADYCRTGRLKRNYGVEPMLRLLSGQESYRETHNALYDAMDELEIMRLLGLHPGQYILL